MAMQVLPMTMRIRMKAQSIRRPILRTWFDEFATQEGIDKDVLFMHLNDFCLQSVRIQTNGKDKMPYEPGLVSDTPETLRKKFGAFMDLPVGEFDRLEQIMNNADAPHDDDLAPDAEPTDPEA